MKDYGKGIKLASDRQAAFTVEKAAAHLDLAEVPGERPLRSQHVRALMEQWKCGNFRPELAPLAVAWVKGRKANKYRINGQHTAYARVELGEASKYDLTFRTYAYECEDLDAVRRLYASFDRGAARTESHVIRVNLQGTDGMVGLGNRVIQSLKAGLKLWLWESAHERKQHSPDEIASLMRSDQYRELISRVGQFLAASGRDGRHLMKAGVTGAILATWAKAPRVAEEFWAAVRDGVSPDLKGKNDPRLRLHRELLTIAATSKGNMTDAKIVSAEATFRGCLRTWRAFRTGKQLTVIRWRVSGERPSVHR